MSTGSVQGWSRLSQAETALAALVDHDLVSIRCRQLKFQFGGGRSALRTRPYGEAGAVHTGETFAGVYRVGDKYLPEAFERMNYVLRDFRTEEVFPMDPRILDILSLLYERLDASESYQVLSGYRSPKTNAMLRGEGTGVARNSFHMYGQAIDIRIPGQNTKIVRNTALDLRAGGVGYYPRSNFVHVDTGKVRSW